MDDEMDSNGDDPTVLLTNRGRAAIRRLVEGLENA